jgi:bifunctional non-homologous end joining protein LigD
MHDKRPMLATPSTSAGGRVAIDINTLDGSHFFDLKMDGIRAFAYWNGAQLTLINRNGVDITRKFPELSEAAAQMFDLPVWLDGEIVCDTGRFEDTLTRDKQSNPAIIARYATEKPVSFYAFDLPDYATETQDQRRTRLEAASWEWDRDGRFKVTPCSRRPEFLANTRDAGLEGVIAKALNAPYVFGARSRAWIKFKNLHRVTALVSGYEPGTGSRAHFGKMNLALLDPTGQVVPCGSVGTGFTMREITELKELLDKGTILVVEIECLNVTSGRTLRFPVYKGLRNDLTALDCTIDQLDALPQC